MRAPTEGGQLWHSYGFYWWQFALVVTFSLAVYAIDAIIFDAEMALDGGFTKRHVASRTLDQLRDGMRQTYVRESLHDQAKVQAVLLRAVCVIASAAVCTSSLSWWSHAERALTHQGLD
jgi:hypothetical protein